MDEAQSRTAVEQPDKAAADRDQTIRAADDLRQEMEKLAHEARDLILVQPPIRFLGYVLSKFHLAILLSNTETEPRTSGNQKEVIKTYQLALEYMHAVWSCHAELPAAELAVDEEKFAELMEVFSALEIKNMMYCLASAAARIDGGAEGHSADTEFHAKTSWSLIRGNRYQALEEEFFRFALEPHSDALKTAYGVVVFA